MDPKLDDQLLVMKYLVDTNKQDFDELNQDNDKPKNKLNKHDSYLEKINTLIKQMLVQNQTSLPVKTLWSQVTSVVIIVSICCDTSSQRWLL